MLISGRTDGSTLFGEELRTRIVGLLAEEQMCTCHLVEEIGAPQPTISYHLKLLRQAGIIDAQASGRFTYYRLVPEALADVAAELRELAVKARRATKVRRPCR